MLDPAGSIWSFSYRVSVRVAVTVTSSVGWLLHFPPLQVFAHNYPSGNYGPPSGFNFDWASWEHDAPLVVSCFSHCQIR
jgi:hypothetical protein